MRRTQLRSRPDIELAVSAGCRTLATPWATPVLSLLLAGAFCGSAGCGSDGGGADAATPPILLGNENNYRATGSLALPTIETASGVDLDICWSSVTTDLQCHPLLPRTDIDNVGLLRFKGLSEDAVEQKLTSGELAQSVIDGYLESRTDHVSTCTKLFDFSFGETVVDVASQYIEDPAETYMLLFAHGTKPGVGARVMTFIKPTASSTNTRVDAPSGCGLLAFTADLSSPKKVPVPVRGPWVVDWRNVTADGLGNEVIFSELDKLLIGFYESKTVADLEASPFEIDTMATSSWDLALTGARTADLSQATNRATAAPFDGFAHGSGTWVLGLFCSTCQNPAPVILAVLEPEGGQ